MALIDTYETLETVGISSDGIDPLQALLIEGRIINDAVVFRHKAAFMRAKMETGGSGILEVEEFLEILRAMPETALAALRSRVKI